MLKRKEKIGKEDVLTGFLYALAYLTEILFFYGAGVVMYGFWQGITGGYLTLFAGMVISGAFVLHILLEIFLKQRTVTDSSALMEILMEGILFTLLGFRINWQAGLTALCGSALTLIIHECVPEKGKTYGLPLCRYAFVLVIGWMALNLFQKKTITFADSVALCSGALFFQGAGFQHQTEETVSWKKEILPFLFATGSSVFLILSLISLSPSYYQILNQAGGFQLSQEYRMVVLWAIISLVLLWIYRWIRNDDSFPIRKVSVCSAAVIGSVFLMKESVLIGMVSLLCLLAQMAALYLLHFTGHDQGFPWNMVCYIGSHIALIVMLAIVFQIYDGITVNYMSVLMTFFLNMAEIFMIHELRMVNV